MKARIRLLKCKLRECSNDSVELLQLVQHTLVLTFNVYNDPNAVVDYCLCVCEFSLEQLELAQLVDLLHVNHLNVFL